MWINSINCAACKHDNAVGWNRKASGRFLRLMRTIEKKMGVKHEGDGMEI